jgi:predicted nucleic acid-binding Zn ribbon protein
LEQCPICGGKLRKLYSPVGIVFKGSGFYSTDARKGKPTAASNTSTDDKSTTSESKPKSDSKPDTTKKTQEKSA